MEAFVTRMSNVPKIIGMYFILFNVAILSLLTLYSWMYGIICPDVRHYYINRKRLIKLLENNKIIFIDKYNYLNIEIYTIKTISPDGVTDNYLYELWVYSNGEITLDYKNADPPSNLIGLYTASFHQRRLNRRIIKLINEHSY